MYSRLALITGCIALASACVSSGPPPSQPPSNAPAPASTPKPIELTPYEFGDEELTIEELETQTLRTGECGLFLFARQPAARFVFFAEAGTGRGKMKLNGQDVAFVRTQVAGQVFDLHYAQQTYETAQSDLTVELTLQPGGGDNTGTRLDGGSLRLSKSDGWSMVTAVSGATTCGVR